MYYSMFLGPRVMTAADDKATIDASIEQAFEADEAGFTAIYVGEQHNNNYEPYSDPFTMGGYLAGQLKQAWIGTSVVPLVLQHPLRLIERMNLLDLLTHGKVIYGLSSGVPTNGTAFGIGEMSPEYRGELFERKLDLLLRAWAHSPQDGALEFDTGDEKGVMGGGFMPMRIMPASYRVPHPMVAVGTNTESKVLETAKRNLYLHLGPTDFEGVKHLAGLYRGGLVDAGLDETAIADKMRWLIHTKWIIVGETDEQAWEQGQKEFGMATKMLPFLSKDPEWADKSLRELHEMDPGPFASSFGRPESPAAWSQRCHIIGSPETVAAKLLEYERIGVPHMHARWIMNAASIDAGRESFRLFVEEVMPRVGVQQIPGPTEEEIRPEFRQEMSTSGKDR